MSSPLIHIRQRPRISINKLGEYLAEHKAARRLAILSAQKKELRCRVVQYRAASHAIVLSLANPGKELEILSAHLQRLRDWSPGSDASDFDVMENRICREAIQLFMEMFPSISLAGLTATRGSNQAPKMIKSGVVISVRPELVLHGTTRRGEPIVGALKLHFPKSYPLDRTAGEYVGAILHEFGERHLAGPGSCIPNHFYVIDVSSKQMFVAPTSYARRRSDVEAACKEIATLWDSIPTDK